LNARYAMVMPVLDAAAFLEESLSSVFDQSMPATELYVVDDNSKDDSVQIIRSFGPEITLLRNTSPGMPAALNLAIARCQSDFISFLDSDDVWLPTKSERQIQVLDGKPEVDVVCGAVINFKMKGEEDDVSSFERRFPPVQTLHRVNVSSRNL